MNIPKKDLSFEYMRGQGPGGQHRNKTDSKVRVTHLPTGIQASADERSQHRSKKIALKILGQRIADQGSEAAAIHKKADRDRKVANSTRVRTYNQYSGKVKDHRTNMERSFDDVVRRGNIQEFLDEALWDHI